MQFEKLRQYLDSLQEVNVPGCDLAVSLDHQVIFRHQAGFRDDQKTMPVRGDEAYWLYSCTKVITTCAAMQLIEKGMMSLDDPVSRYLPAYGSLSVRDQSGVHAAARTLTIRHLMSMQSGMDYNLTSPSIQQALRETNGRASTRQLVDAMAHEPLCFEPGENFLYSLSHDVLAAVIEVVSGMRFSAYLRKNIFDPLELDDTFSFCLNDSLRKRLCAPYVMEENGLKLQEDDCNNYHLSPDYESGGAGLLGDVRSYLAVVDALACAETKNGQRLLSPEMTQLWRANQLGPASRRTFDLWNRKGYSYALGVRTRVDLSTGGPGSIGEFGWDGAAGAWAMIDPTLHLSAFFAMHVRNFGYSYDVIHPTIRGLIYEGLRAEG